MKVKLTKLSDDVFEGNHPNGIQEGYVFEGEPINKPIVGERFMVVMTNYPKYINTSTVTEILQETNGLVTKFKTKNSTYKLEYEKHN